MAGLGAVVIAALVVSRTGRAPGETTVNVVSGRPTAAPLAVGRREPALTFIRGHDGTGAAHVLRLVWSGPMLRVYTDLPVSAANSRTAVALCRAAAAYLRGQGRGQDVFVHARSSDGYPVLANKLGARDGCRLNDVP